MIAGGRCKSFYLRMKSRRTLTTAAPGRLDQRLRTKKFRMFRGGSIWNPPLINFYTQGMPEELLMHLEGIDYNKGNLSVT